MNQVETKKRNSSISKTITCRIKTTFIKEIRLHRQPLFCCSHHKNKKSAEFVDCYRSTNHNYNCEYISFVFIFSCVRLTTSFIVPLTDMKWLSEPNIRTHTSPKCDIWHLPPVINYKANHVCIILLWMFYVRPSSYSSFSAGSFYCRGCRRCCCCWCHLLQLLLSPTQKKNALAIINKYKKYYKVAIFLLICCETNIKPFDGWLTIATKG